MNDDDDDRDEIPYMHFNQIDFSIITMGMKK
jgi:hypothetical protein